MHNILSQPRTAMTPLFIFDIDGTLADCSHRLPLLNSDSPDKWNLFYKACPDDEPIIPVISVLNGLLRHGAEVLFFTGRSGSVWAETKQWLQRWTDYTGSDGNRIYMRPEKDFRPDFELKHEWYSRLLPEDKHALVGVFEDRTRCVEMWRELGVTCFQVTNGDF